MTHTLETLFVTKVYRSELGTGDPFITDLAEACRQIASQDRAGQAWSREKGYRGYTSYASLDDLPRRDSLFDDLKRKLDKHAAAFAKDLHLDLGGRRLKLDSLWINILKPGGMHSGHIHPHSVISGTVYVSVPDGAGALRLEDPRLSQMMAAPTRQDDAPRELQTFVALAPQAGTILMWESWLRHEVLVNGAKSERISISFNYAW
jgi:uncharacterized protein (TIGR02466 family)